MSHDDGVDGPSNWNFADVWETVATIRPGEPALIQGGRRLRWHDVDRRADGIARALLDAGLRRQAKVAQHLYNSPEYIESLFASLKVGMVPVNTNYRYAEDELRYLWDNADVEAVVFGASLRDRVDAVRQRLARIRLFLWVDDEGDGICPPWALPYEVAAGGQHDRTMVPWGRTPDDLILVYTGGTTGLPKGVMWRQDDLFAILNATAEVRYPHHGDLDDVKRVLSLPHERPVPRLIPCPPLMHGSGMLTALSVLNAGGSLVLLEGRSFSPRELLDAVERERANELVIVGDAFARPILRELDAHPGRCDLSSLWLIISAGVMWSEETKRALLHHLPGVLMLDNLGSSEALSIGRSRSSRSQPASTGRFELGRNTRVIDDHGREITPGSGEVGLVALRGRGPLGYYKDPEKTAATFRVIDGERYSVPGDFATVEANGEVRLLGRGSVCINTGGEKVFPEEVEEVLKLHVAVEDAVVVGVPHDRFGEAVVGIVQAKHGRDIEPDELIAHVKAALAAYKAPKRIVVVTSVGRAPSGKVDYRALRSLAVERVGTLA